MRAYALDGLTLEFNIKDKEILLNGGTIREKLRNNPKQIAVVTICDKVKEGTFLSEQGFFTYSHPKGYDKRILYRVYIDKSVSKRLISRGFDAIRCEYDRLDISYADI